MLYIIDFWKVRYYYEFIIKNSLKSHQRLNNENKAESFQSCCICFVTGIASLCVYPWSEVLVQDFPQYFRILAAMRALQPWCVLWGFGSKCSNPAIWIVWLFSLFSRLNSAWTHRVFKDVRLSYTGICNARFEGYCEASLQVNSLCAGRNRYKQIVQRSARSAALPGCMLCKEMKFVKVFSKLWLSCWDWSSSCGVSLWV